MSSYTYQAHIASSEPMTNKVPQGSSLGSCLTLASPNPHYKPTFGSLTLCQVLSVESQKQISLPAALSNNILCSYKANVKKKASIVHLYMIYYFVIFQSCGDFFTEKKGVYIDCVEFCIRYIRNKIVPTYDFPVAAVTFFFLLVWQCGRCLVQIFPFWVSLPVFRMNIFVIFSSPYCLAFSKGKPENFRFSTKDSNKVFLCSGKM